MILLILYGIIIKSDFVSSECTDIYGRSITPGIHFIPGPDICQLCVCDNTTPKWCKRVLCSPPQNCKSFVMGSSCCDYSCLDNPMHSGDLRDEIDRRFLITIATAVLILTILLFIIHKLRTRNMQVGRLQNRQLAEDRRSIGSIGFITGSIGYLNLSNGHHFDDHPLVHFPMYKPHANYFPRGEAPPPYEEAMADTALGVSAATQLLTNERETQEMSDQRRRCNSTGVAISANDLSGNIVERCICEPQQQFKINRAHIDITNAYSCAVQHRTIPIPICVTSESLNQHGSALSNNSLCRRTCPIHNNNLDTMGGVDPEQRGRANSISHARFITSSMCNTCHSELHLDPTQTAGTSHRTLPLSASLSSPLPSTSDSCDRHPQLTNFSSAVNISLVNEKESSSNSAKPFEQPEKSPSAVFVAKEAELKTKKSSKCPTEREIASPTEVKDIKSESDNTQLVEDYHAECENCNFNVNADCDVTEEYFPEQETMTLQRKLHEASAAKNIDQSMKASLTLPANSRTKRCSTKNRSCNRWNGQESPFKTMLEYVSSEDEEKDVEKSQHNTSGSDDKV